MLAALSVVSCGGGGGGGSNPPGAVGPSVTLVAKCIVDAQDDVMIGAGAPAGCGGQVAMEPSDNPPALAQITINTGGTLVVGPQSSQSSAGIGGLVGRLLARAAAWVGVANAQAVSSYPPVAEICVADGGTLTYGTAAAPITNATKIVQEFRGDRFFAPIGVKGKTPCAFDLGPLGLGFQKGIDVLAGGTLEMFGAKGVPSYKGVSWTHLRQPAGLPVAGANVAPPPLNKGDQVLELADDVTTVTAPGEAWQPDDWIVVGTTSFVPFETEFVQIKTVSPNPATGGSTVTLEEPLKYYHFGSEAPTADPISGPDGSCKDRDGNTVRASFCDKANKNYGVDERAEVGLISRDIKLTSAVPDSAESLHWGGEIKIHQGFKKVSIQGVEIEKFGKDQLGSYPIHFHMAGDVTSQAPLVDSNSIHHSYNKCITIHATENMTVQNNVCARVVGQIFYEETGAEDNITFLNNLGLGAMSNSFDIYDITTVPPNPMKVTRMELIDKYWWTGDYLTNNVPSSATFNPAFPAPNGYDGFNIPNTDDQTNPVHGLCQKPNTNFQGGFGITRDPQAPVVTKENPEGKIIPCQSGGTCSFQPTDPNCALPEFYTLPANGFWISNPTTILSGNSIGGCQGVGRGYWWVPPNKEIMINGDSVNVQFLKVGKFSNNRAHSCYAGFYGEGEFSVTGSGQFFPHADGTASGLPLVANFDGMTASRNRYRGMWLRPSFFAITNPRFATNRLSMSLVTSGGIDGNAPGAWDIVKDGVLVGLSQNNVDRFGACPFPNSVGQFTGGMAGCVDKTPYCDNCSTLPKGVTAHSADEIGQGYADPSQNFFGYMLYDGPVRVFDDRFVNFNADIDKKTTFTDQLTQSDKTYLTFYEKNNTTPTGQGPPFEYEGDAVFGWFQSNQSSYPTGTTSRGLIFENTNLRHQVYTELVSLSNQFNDGDKNTAVIDEDGTLSGLSVINGDGVPEPGVFPISLNNLPFNSASNSVDECLSRGGQNEAVEGRESSLISPGSLGTLEFSTLWPFGIAGSKDTKSGGETIVFPGQSNSHTQLLTFSRDDLVPDGEGGTLRPTETLHSRNGLGVWEPKVTSGFGYTVSAAVARQAPPPRVPPYPQQPGYNLSTERVGISSFIDVGLADVVKPNISASNPFYVRVGICYTRADGTHPTDASKFTIMRGYKSFIGAGVSTDAANNLYSTQLPCNNLDNAVPNNVLPNPAGLPNCPSASTAPLPLEGGGCPARSKLSEDKKSCIFEVQPVTKADTIGGLVDADGTPKLDKYFYDDNSGSAGFGMLYFYAAQDQPNAIAPSPLGSCSNPPNPETDDPSCPDFTMSKHKFRESYYACPAQGCTVYTIYLNDPNYKYSVDLTDPNNNPAASTCKPYPLYAQSAPAKLGQLVLAGTTKPPITFQTNVDKQGVPFNTVTGPAPSCPVTAP
ncbi:MAG TPA: hypothetical protein VGY99_17225 [Candidatus Binataceae bacterium]|jgi:hypothetical protein|nr:hypothetical protein [Candidatus Binataceae bacterium]